MKTKNIITGELLWFKNLDECRKSKHFEKYDDEWCRVYFSHGPSVLKKELKYSGIVTVVCKDDVSVMVEVEPGKTITIPRYALRKPTLEEICDYQAERQPTGLDAFLKKLFAVSEKPIVGEICEISKSTY